MYVSIKYYRVSFFCLDIHKRNANPCGASCAATCAPSCEPSCCSGSAAALPPPPPPPSPPMPAPPPLSCAPICNHWWTMQQAQPQPVYQCPTQCAQQVLWWCCTTPSTTTTTSCNATKATSSKSTATMSPRLPQNMLPSLLTSLL